MNKNILYNIVFAILVLLFFLSGYLKQTWYRVFPKASEYGIEFNSERIKRGVLPIPEDWTTDDFAKYLKTWKGTKRIGIRKSKIVGVDEKGIDFEVDYISKEGQTIEMIYNYRDEKEHWQITIQKNGQTISLQKEQVDSLLAT